MRMQHHVRVDRAEVTRDAYETSETWSTVHAALPCLIEPIGAKQQLSVLGVIEGARYNITWRAGELREGDRVLYGASWWILHLPKFDTGVGSRAVRCSTAVLARAAGVEVA